MSENTQPSLLDRFSNAPQYTGPNMLFNHQKPGTNGNTKMYLNLDPKHGVRTDITGLPNVSGSAAPSYDFNPHQPPRQADLRHVDESPGGIPFSLDHKAGISRATSIAQQQRARSFGQGAIGGVASHLISGETATALKFSPNQVRAKTPPYTRGTEQRVGQNRYNVTEDRPMVGGIGNPNLSGHIDTARMKTTLTAKIPLNTVTEKAFQTATHTAQVEGNQMREFMRAARPEMVYYNQETVNASREQMLSTKKTNDDKYNAPKNFNKKHLLSSQLVRDSLEDHNPVQEMVYQHHNNATVGRT